MWATSGASRKRRPFGVSRTMPSKMCERVSSSTRRTLPSSTPSAERTTVPRRSAWYEIACPSSTGDLRGDEGRRERDGDEYDGDAHDAALPALAAGEGLRPQSEEPEDDGPQRQHAAADVEGGLGRLVLVDGQDERGDVVHHAANLSAQEGGQPRQEVGVLLEGEAVRCARVGDELRVRDQLGEMALVGDRQEPVELAAADERVSLQAAHLRPIGIASGHPRRTGAELREHDRWRCDPVEVEALQDVRDVAVARLDLVGREE